MLVRGSSGGSGIKLDVSRVNESINELRSSIESLETTFSETIEGDNKLEMVELYNEFKQQYDNLLAQYQALFIKNVQSTQKSADELVKADQTVASDIRLLT